jgi:hypothetical protein
MFIDPENKVDGELIPEKPVIGFEENGVEYWCTKSVQYFVEL